MAISEIPSLHLKPVAYKTNRLYLKLPEGSIGNMTFARTSVATRVNKEGLIEEVATGIPRLDHALINGVVQSCPELLLEPTSINLALWSEEFDNVYWAKSRVSVLANQLISPDGTITSDRLIDNIDNNTHRIISQGITKTIASQIFTLSCFFKKGNIDLNANIKITDNIESDSANATINIQTGILINQSDGNNYSVLDTKIEAYIDGWFRFSVIFLTPVSTTSPDNNIRFHVGLSSSVGNIGFVGTGNDYIHILGADVESLNYATSYIKTEGGTETRATEILNNVGDSTTFNSEEGVLYVDMAALYDDGTNRSIAISDGTSSNRVFLRYSATSNTVDGLVIVGGGTQANMNFAVSDVTEFSKIALKWKVNDFALWVDGEKRATELSGISFGANVLTTLSFDNSVGGDDLFGRVRDLRVYKTALTDAELTELTNRALFLSRKK